MANKKMTNNIPSYSRMSVSSYRKARKFKSPLSNSHKMPEFDLFYASVNMTPLRILMVCCEGMLRKDLSKCTSDKEILKYFAETRTKTEMIEKVIREHFPQYIKHLKWLAVR